MGENVLSRIIRENVLSMDTSQYRLFEVNWVSDNWRSVLTICRKQRLGMSQDQIPAYQPKNNMLELYWNGTCVAMEVFNNTNMGDECRFSNRSDERRQPA